MLRGHLPVLLQIIVAVGFAGSALIVSVLLGKAGRRNRIKDSLMNAGWYRSANRSRDSA